MAIFNICCSSRFQAINLASVLRVVIAACCKCFLFVFAAAGFGTQAWADMEDPLVKRLSPQLVSELVPGVSGIRITESEPPVAILEVDGQVEAYVFSTHETVNPAGYSGQSFDIMVVLLADGAIGSHRIVEHREPLIGTRQVTIADVDHFLSQLHGLNVNTTRQAPVKNMDGISGATVSANAMWNAVMGSSVIVGYLMGLVSDDGGGLSVDRFTFVERTWEELIADESIRVHSLTKGFVRKEFFEAGIALELDGPDEEEFVTLYTALATPPSVGRNLFGSNVFGKISQSAVPGEHQLLVASMGSYRWTPLNPYLVDIFDRIRLVQGEVMLPLETRNFYPARRYAAYGAPALNQGGRFRIPSAAGFDPIKEWSLGLSLIGQDSNHDSFETLEILLPYRVPSRHVVGGNQEMEDAGLQEIRYVGWGQWRQSTLLDWQLAWVNKQSEILALLVLLLTVTLILSFQQYLTQARRLYKILRVGVLAVTLIWLGWIAGAQLTVLSLINYFRLLAQGAEWGAVLFDPLLIILTGYVVVTLFLWGRGVFCGWLCPFGALQELLAKLGKIFSLPRIEPSVRIQKYGNQLKYFVAGGIIFLALFSAQWSAFAAEIEPFKTAISLHFGRSWPYVLYAALLLGAGLFIERFFCRYLCPLGAILAVGGKFRLVNSLLRRPECGNPCHLCEHSCPIGAIQPDGEINMDECQQCLDCQVEYHDPNRCPPLTFQLKPSS